MKNIFKGCKVWGLLFIIIVTVFCEYYEILSLIEDQTLSYRQLIRTSFRPVPSPHERDVVLVSLDDEYYKKTNIQPYKRSDLAKIIRNVHKLGARLIVVDILMPHEHPELEGDAELYELFDNPAYDNVILSSHIEFKTDCAEGVVVYPSKTVSPPLRPTGYINIISPSTVVTFLSRLRIYPSLAQSYNIWPLAVMSASKFLNVTPRLENNILHLGDKRFQLDQHNDLYIDYSPVPANSQYLNDFMGLTALPFIDVIYPVNYGNAAQYFESINNKSKENEHILELMFWIKDKIVVIGDTSITSQNWFDTPVGTMFGSEIVADTISTLLSNTSLRPASLAIEALISILMLTLIFLSVARCHNVRYSFLLYITINIIFTTLCFIVYMYDGYIITMTYNYLFGLIGYLVITLYYRSIDTQKKEQARLQQKKIESKYQGIFENAIEGMFQVNEKGLITAINPSALRILGYDSLADLQNIILDRNTRLYVDSKDQQKIIQLMNEKSIVNDFETRFYRKDGSLIWVSFNVRCTKDALKHNIYEGSFVDITEKKMRIKAEKEAEAAKVAMKSRTEILGSMSHELKTPLNAILGMAESLKNSELSDQQKRDVEVFEMAGEHLLTLINDILQLTKLEFGKIDLNIVSFDLSIFIDTIKKIMEVQQKQYKNVKIIYNIQETMPDKIRGDKIRLQQIITNLMDNALKFTPQGTITLTITTVMLEEFSKTYLPDVDDEQTQFFFFQVKDTGVGIPESKQKAIFDTFCQIKNNNNANVGAGLGLPICKRLVEIMNGVILLNSEVDKGSTFSFAVPIELNLIAEIDNDICVVSGPLEILLVEDNLNNQIVFQALLDDTDHQIEIAWDGEEGVEKFKSKKYDIVFMDLQMPRMNGFEATRKIREYENENNLAETPIIAVSAQTFFKKENKATRAGCNNNLEKPIKKGVLMNILHQYGAKNQPSDHIEQLSKRS
jgi:PAS domain S-box-containing protein